MYSPSTYRASLIHVDRFALSRVYRFSSREISSSERTDVSFVYHLSISERCCAVDTDTLVLTGLKLVDETHCERNHFKAAESALV